jgi:hypothetical protein
MRDGNQIGLITEDGSKKERSLFPQDTWSKTCSQNRSTMEATKMLFDHQMRRREFDWIAADGIGRLGYFATAGLEPVPLVVADCADEYESVFEVVRALPEIGQAVIDSQAQWDISEWVEVARRGVFAYDCRVGSSRYELIAKPAVPLLLPTVTDDQLRQLFARVQVSDEFAVATAFIVTVDQFCGGGV